MAVETEIKNSKTSSQKEFESLLNEDFKDRKLKENEIIKATVTEITKNFIVVDCKAKMEGMIPIEEFKHDSELEKLKVGSSIEVYLERIESFKGEIVISEKKQKEWQLGKKWKKYSGLRRSDWFYNRQWKICLYCRWFANFYAFSQIDVRPLKKIDHLMNTQLKL